MMQQWDENKRIQVQIYLEQNSASRDLIILRFM